MVFNRSSSLILDAIPPVSMKAHTRGVDAVMIYKAPFSVNVSQLDALRNDTISGTELRGENFGGSPIGLAAKLRVVDCFNSAGVMVDAKRCCVIAKQARNWRRARNRFSLAHEKRSRSILIGGGSARGNVVLSLGRLRDKKCVNR